MIHTTQQNQVINKTSPFYALSFPNFRLFFIGQLISVAGTWMQSIAQQWLVWDITHSTVWLGIVAGASAIPYIAFSIWGGQVADRHSRRKILIWTQVIPMLMAFILAALATNRWVHVQGWHIAVLSAIGGLVNAFNMPAQQAFVFDMVDEREALGNAIALNSMRFNLARFMGPILAGVVLARWGAFMCFFLNGLSFIAVIISLYMMRLKPFTRRESDVNIWGGLQYVMRDRSMLRVIALIGMGSLFAWSASTLFPVFADHFKHGAGGYSAMMAANGVGAALGAFSLAAFGHRMSRRRSIYIGAFGFSIGLLLLTVMSNYYLALCTLVLCGYMMIFFGISSNTKVQEDSPDRLRGRVMAVYSLVFGGMMPVGGLEIGFLAQQLGRHTHPLMNAGAHTMATYSGAVSAIRVNVTLCIIATAFMLIWSIVDSKKNHETETA